jgi:acyl dehydratase
MRYPAALVGRSTAAVHHTADARWLLAYAAVLDETDPRLTDTRRDDFVAHPLFPVCVEWAAVTALQRANRDPEGGGVERALQARSVHASHDLRIHRPIRAGDELETTARVVAAEQRRPGVYEVMRLETATSGGEPVATTDMGALYLGVELEGDPVPADADAPARAPASTRAEPAARRPLPRGFGHTYTECARIWNPIHTDPAAAEAAGLPDIILHGTASLALAISAAWPLIGGPDRIGRIRARFTGMVVLPDELAVTLDAGDSAVAARVTRGDGVAVVDGIEVQAR